MNKKPVSRELTSREREVADAVRRGASNRQIAQRLGISDKTVKNHLTGIFAKIGVASRLELALALIRTEGGTGE